MSKINYIEMGLVALVAIRFFDAEVSGAGIDALVSAIIADSFLMRFRRWNLMKLSGVFQ